MPPDLDRARLAEIARGFRLRWGRFPLAGRVGQKLGAGTGSSIEFQDYRAYAPGDDVRHVDWRAFARTDALTVRLFREEIAPRVDLVVDETESTAVEDAKRARIEELAVLFGLLARGAQASLRLIGSGAPREVRDPLALEFSRAARHDPWPALAGSLRWRSARVVLSDFLFPHDPSALLKTLARDAGILFVIQVNSPAEIDPDFRGPLRLVDAEDGEELDLEVGPREVERYKARFERLRDDLRRECFRARALFSPLSTAFDLEGTVRELARAAIVEAR